MTWANGLISANKNLGQDQPGAENNEANYHVVNHREEERIEHDVSEGKAD